MAKKYGLVQQLSSLHVLRAGIAAGAIKEIEYYDKMTTFHLLVLDEVIATLSCIRDHEDVIKRAIKATNQLDDAPARD